MKNQLFLSSSLLFLAACSESNELLNIEETQNLTTPPSSSNLEYIRQHAGLNLATRADDVSISPYIYEGDTVLFVVNYTNGWELLTNDTSVQMVLASSENGNIDLEDENNPESFKAYIACIAEELHDRSMTGLRNSYVCSDWRPYTYAELISPNDTIYRRPTLGENEYLMPEICGFDAVSGLGHWELNDQTLSRIDTLWIQPHLMTTHWSQEAPYNEYTPIINGHHCVAGCVAIAIGQYLYYLTNDRDMPIYMPNSAQYNEADTCWVFGDEYTLQWSKPSRTISGGPRTNYLAMAIGYIGKSCHMKYGLYSSGASMFPDYLSSLGLFRPTECNQTNEYIGEHLQNGFPLLAHAYSDDGSFAHMFVVDGGKTTNYRVRNTYVWVPVDEDGNETIAHDATGRPVQYMSIHVDDVTKESFLINWGWGGFLDDAYFTVYLKPDGGNIAINAERIIIINTGL